MPTDLDIALQHLKKRALSGKKWATMLTVYMRALEAEVKDHKALIELQHKRMAEATALWCAATGRVSTWPDLGELLEWLLAERDRLLADVHAWHDCYATQDTRLSACKARVDAKAQSIIEMASLITEKDNEIATLRATLANCQSALAECKDNIK